MTAETLPETIREKIARIAADGWDAVEIGAVLKIPHARVQQVLDQLDDASVRPAGVAAKVAPVVPVAAATSNGTPGPKHPARKAEHGTRAGYARHYAHGEKPCQPCKDAYNAHMMQVRAAKKVTTPQAEPAAVTPTPVVADRVRVQVRWLIPRGQDHTNLVAQYGVERRPGSGRVEIVSAETAEVLAGQGEKVLSRYVTPWVDAR